ncbi:MAG: hypothetical protein K5651_05555 [Bacteroidales bacterium]|nr:hypothetical protein [Bacteroidales bacterium]
MTLKEQIMQISQAAEGPISSQRLMASLSSQGISPSKAVVFNALSALVSEGRLKRVSPGVYAAEYGGGQDFICTPDQRILSWNAELKKRFPFIDICIWDIKEITSLMHHIPSVKMILVEVPRETTEAVAQRMGELSNLLIMDNPSEQVLKKYALGREVVVVKPLVSQAPVTISNGVLTPRIEKLLVDILTDTAFYHLRGSESDYIYGNAFDGFRVNKKSLMRYASRRRKQNEVEQIIQRNQL